MEKQRSRIEAIGPSSSRLWLSRAPGTCCDVLLHGSEPPPPAGTPRAPREAGLEINEVTHTTPSMVPGPSNPLKVLHDDSGLPANCKAQAATAPPTVHSQNESVRRSSPFTQLHGPLPRGACARSLKSGLLPGLDCSPWPPPCLWPARPWIPKGRTGHSLRTISPWITKDVPSVGGQEGIEVWTTTASAKVLARAEGLDLPHSGFRGAVGVEGPPVPSTWGTSAPMQALPHPLLLIAPLEAARPLRLSRSALPMLGSQRCKRPAGWNSSSQRWGGTASPPQSSHPHSNVRMSISFTAQTPVKSQHVSQPVTCVSSPGTGLLGDCSWHHWAGASGDITSTDHLASKKEQRSWLSWGNLLWSRNKMPANKSGRTRV